MKVRYVALLIWALAATASVQADDRPAEKLVRERCHKCHGLNGESSEPEFPKLAGQNVDYMTRQMANFKTGVRKSARMKSKVEDLSGDEMRALAEYFSAKTLVPEHSNKTELIDAGRRLYFSGHFEHGVTACTTCHGPLGRGGIYLPRLAGQNVKYLVAQLHAFRDFSRTSPNMVMHTVVENISDAEIDAVAEFLSTME